MEGAVGDAFGHGMPFLQKRKGRRCRLLLVLYCSKGREMPMGTVIGSGRPDLGS